MCSTDEVAAHAFGELDVLDDVLAWRAQSLEGTSCRVFCGVVNEDVASVVEVKLSLSSLDGALSFDSANLPGSFISRDLAVSEASVVVKNTAVVGVTERKNVHETNATSSFFADASIDLSQSVVENVSNFTG